MARELVWSDDLSEAAAATFAEHADSIREHLPDVEVRHTGGTSVPGVLTTGDVDLHVRTDARSFETARNALSGLYELLHPHAWTDESAFFFSPGTRPRVEVALTVVGSEDDLRHGALWERIRADPELRERYNDLKRTLADSSDEDYAVAKRDFFRENFS